MEIGGSVPVLSSCLSSPLTHGTQGFESWFCGLGASSPSSPNQTRFTRVCLSWLLRRPRYCRHSRDTQAALTSRVLPPFCPPVASASAGKISPHLKGDKLSCAFCFNACRKWTQIFAKPSDIFPTRHPRIHFSWFFKSGPL